MTEVKDPAIKLFGRTIPLPLIIPNDSSSPSSSPPEFSSAIQQETEEPSRKEPATTQDDDASQQTAEDLKSLTTSSVILENPPKTPSAETENSLLKSSTNGEQSETSVSEEKTLKKPDKIIPCPRCNSMDTKFCYFNNYNVNQPRHFCKKCQRYWTAGGTMRNVPVGAGRRKNKNLSSSHYRHLIIPEAAKLNSPNGLHMGNGAAVLAFDSGSPLCNTMASVLNIAERTQNCVPNGFHHPNSYGGESGHSNAVSVTTSTSSERKGHADTNGSVDKRVEGFPPQLQYIPSPLLPYPWSSAMPPPAFCPPNYPLAFYTPVTPPAYWGCVPPPWPNISYLHSTTKLLHFSTLSSHLFSLSLTTMTEPSSKPNGNAAINGTAAAATTNGNGNPLPVKSQLYNPNRQVYRPQSQYNRRRRSNRSLCCCCCFWTILTVLAVALLVAIVGAGIYVLYHPRQPQFSITNLRIVKMNLTTSTDSPSHLTTLFNLTLIAKNPNNHLVFFYDPFTVTAFSDSVQIGNGSLPAFNSDKNNQTSLRSVLSNSQDLDTDSLTSLRSGLKKKKGFPVVIHMDTKVKMKMEWLKSKKVGIRVTCGGIRGTVPAGKSPAVASVIDSECKVDLRIKIWKFSF